ncbi:hypothetical protein HPB51_001639 [Rhipicephalus microplus]|uniref:Uncharacterized protein n=1 Tax=Rhipicephalus microplus TaxID=6941 RepID=A0A9J6EVU8_RHIMP|nr:hypothetical protein HPB51_001639 [Rhipicephalus microplus]
MQKAFILIWQVEVLRKFSKTAAKSQLVKTVTAECRTLSKNTNMAVSLLQVATSNVHKSFLRAYVASLASCVMGDLSPNACLTKHHQGRPLVLSPMAAGAARPQESAPLFLAKDSLLEHLRIKLQQLLSELQLEGKLVKMRASLQFW